MKLFVVDEEKITNFYLPEEISEMFLFSYMGVTQRKENHISIESADNKWFLKSNGSVDAIDDSGISISSVELSDLKIIN